MSANAAASNAGDARACNPPVRRRAPRMAPPGYALPEKVIKTLSAMLPDLAAEVGAALMGGSKRPGLYTPNDRDDDTQQMAAGAVLDAVRALGDYGMAPGCVAEMVTPAALDILRRRIDDVIWEEVNLCRVLVALGTLYRYIHTSRMPGPLRHRISYHLRAVRRDQWDNLRTPAECIAGAVAAAGLADVMSAAGQQKLARSRFRDAVILAVGAEANFRTQEFCYVDIESIGFTVVDDIEVAEMFMAARFCKNRKARIGIVNDPAALFLLRRLIGERKDGPLFCNFDGSRMTPQSIAGAIRRTSLLTLGVPLSANLLRRAGVSDEEDEEEMARRIGDKKGGSRGGTAVKYYGKSVAREGLALLREE